MASHVQGKSGKDALGDPCVACDNTHSKQVVAKSKGEKEYEDAPGLNCAQGHFLCIEGGCLRSYLKNVLLDVAVPILPLPCPVCKIPLPLLQLQAYFTEAEAHAFTSADIMTAMKAAACEFEELEWCSACTKYGVILGSMHVNSDESPLFACENQACKKVTCRVCRRTDIDVEDQECEVLEIDLSLVLFATCLSRAF